MTNSRPSINSLGMTDEEHTLMLDRLNEAMEGYFGEPRQVNENIPFDAYRAAFWNGWAAAWEHLKSQ